jgi:DNA-binding CsgD family transcriptional regulator
VGLRLSPSRVTPTLRHTTVSDPARATAHDVDQLDRAIDRLADETDPRRIVRVAAAALAVDRGAGCRAALQRVAAGGAVTPALRALALLCADDHLTGRWDECVQRARDGADLATTHGHHLLAAPLRLVEALVAAARGDSATAAALAGHVDAWARPREDRALGWAVHRVSALAALADGDPEHAFRCASAVGPAGTLAPHPSAVAVAGDLVEAAARSGRTGGAARHARAMRQAPLAAVSPRFAMVAAGAAAVAASPDAAATALFEEALATPGADRWAFDRARTQLAYGEHLRRSRDPASARPQLGAALGTFRRLSAEPWTARVRDELRAVGARTDGLPTAPAPRRPSPTAEELEAAVLAASGLTNKQIAGRLRLSHRTVSARLYQVFPKLGVVSRAGLRDALREWEPSGGPGAVGA